jgi:hypothetical protein
MIASFDLKWVLSGCLLSFHRLPRVDDLHTCRLKIAARGIYRDPVRSSHGHFVKASGLRWLSFMVLAPVPWAGVVKALPVLTLLAPSERVNTKQGRRHKTLTDWARQGIMQLCRWLPERRFIFVVDSSFGTHDLVQAVKQRATLISRLRLDANLFERPPERSRHSLGRPARKGADERQPSWPVPTTTLAGGAGRKTGMPVWRAAPPA